jgi:hypothetical protein
MCRTPCISGLRGFPQIGLMQMLGVIVQFKSLKYASSPQLILLETVS